MAEKIKRVAKNYGVIDDNEVNLIIRAIKEKNDELIQEIITPKKWKEFKKELSQFKEKESPKASILHFRYSVSLYDKNFKQEKAIKAIIMGPCGNGKTCLVNHLCGSDLPFGDTKHSLTRNITELKSQFQYPVPFVIYDTPGTTAHVDKMEHATHLKCLLEHKPINTVCILIKYDGRYDQLINNIFRQVKMLEDYQQNIVFLISHFDLAKNPQSTVKIVDEMLTQLQLKNQVVYFSNNQTNEKLLSDSIYSICVKMKQVQIKIDTKIFLKYFNLKKQETQEIYFKKFQKQILKQMEEVSQSYINFAVTLPNNEERDAIFQDLEITMKNQLKELLDKFVQKYKNTMSVTEYYTSFYTLQLKINQHLKSFQDKIRGLQKHNFIESSATGQHLDIRDLIKRCPNPSCGLIWFRIEKCPDTSCGNRPSCAFDFLSKAVFRYKFVRDKNKIFKIIRLDEKERKNLQNKSIVNNMTVEQRVKKGKVGCEQSMNFETLPRLPDIQKILMEWYDVHTIQEVIVRFQADEQLEKTRKELEKKVNQSFFSSLKF